MTVAIQTPKALLLSKPANAAALLLHKAGKLPRVIDGRHGKQKSPFAGANGLFEKLGTKN